MEELTHELLITNYSHDDQRLHTTSLRIEGRVIGFNILISKDHIRSDLRSYMFERLL